MNPSITCANQFSPTQTVGDIAGFRSTRSCLESAPIRCCLLDGSCQATFRDACLNLGGFWTPPMPAVLRKPALKLGRVVSPTGSVSKVIQHHASQPARPSRIEFNLRRRRAIRRAPVTREVFIDLHPAGGRTEIWRTELSQFANVGKILGVTGTSERPLVLASATELRQNPEDLGRLGDIPGPLSGWRFLGGARTTRRP